MPKCKHEGCQKGASYGNEYRKLLYCTTHKEPGMYIVTTKLCLGEGCKKYPHYNYPGNTKGIYCITHKSDGMCVVGKHCVENGCTNNALYNYKNMKRAYCIQHRKENMVESGKPICDNCLSIATYGLENNKPSRCFEHKTESMIDLFHSKCNYIGCSLRAYYNIAGNKNPMYCLTHKPELAINTSASKCIENGCNKSPSYNFKGCKERLYCVTHAKPEMIDLNKPVCKHSDYECINNPVYNFEGQTARLYCKEHKLAGMIDISYMPCEYENCNVRPIFNYHGEQNGRYCKTHKLENMIDVINNRCEHPDCNISPTYNYPGEKKRRYCASHYIPGMINISKQYCKIPLCDTTINRKCDGYCLRCYIHMFPDKPVVRNYKTKEKAVVDEVVKAFPNFTWIHDRRVQDGCSARRPDLIADFGTHVIIVEIDETMHQGYSCENKRMMELSQDIGHRPVVFIRFNPDSYTDETGHKVKSCFTTNKMGITTVSKLQQKQWNQRIDTLLNCIKSWALTPFDKTINMVHLFYDQYACQPFNE